MSLSKISQRYAQSLMDLAQDQGVLNDVVGDIQMMQRAFEVREFENLINSPIVKADKKKSILSEIFGGKISDLTTAYLNLLVQKGRESFLPHISGAFMDIYRKMQNTTRVTVTTARAMDEAAIKALESKLAASDLTDDKVELEIEVDESLIGGFTIDMEGMQYDGSVRKKLNDLRQSFN